MQEEQIRIGDGTTESMPQGWKKALPPMVKIDPLFKQNLERRMGRKLTWGYFLEKVSEKLCLKYPTPYVVQSFSKSSFEQFCSTRGTGVAWETAQAILELFARVLPLPSNCKYGDATSDRPALISEYVNVRIVGLQEGKALEPSKPCSEAEPSIQSEFEEPRKFLILNLMTLPIAASASIALFAESQAFPWNIILYSPFIVFVMIWFVVTFARHYCIYFGSKAVGQEREGWLDFSKKLEMRLKRIKTVGDRKPHPFRLRVTKYWLNDFFAWTGVVMVVSTAMILSITELFQSVLAVLAASSLICVVLWIPAALAYMVAVVLWRFRFTVTACRVVFFSSFVVFWFVIVGLGLRIAAPTWVEELGLFVAVAQFAWSPISGLITGMYFQSLAASICFLWAATPAIRIAWGIFKHQDHDDQDRSICGNSLSAKNAELKYGSTPELNLEDESDQEKYMCQIFREYFDEDRIVVRAIEPLKKAVLFLISKANHFRE